MQMAQHIESQAPKQMAKKSAQHRRRKSNESALALPDRRPPDARWSAVQTRDKRADGNFVYAVRSTGMAISYNVAVTVFGGFAPLTVTWMIASTGNKLMPAFYIIGAALISLVVVGATVSGVQRRMALAHT